LLVEGRKWEEVSNTLTHPKKSLAEKGGNWEKPSNTMTAKEVVSLGQELGGSIKYLNLPKEAATWDGWELGGRTVMSVACEKPAEIRSIGWMNAGETEVRRVVPC
jgi:hypothetical protein